MIQHLLYVAGYSDIYFFCKCYKTKGLTLFVYKCNMLVLVGQLECPSIIFNRHSICMATHICQYLFCILLATGISFSNITVASHICVFLFLVCMPAWLNVFSQMSHLGGFSPVCIALCLLRPWAWMYCLSQILHL